MTTAYKNQNHLNGHTLNKSKSYMQCLKTDKVVYIGKHWLAFPICLNTLGLIKKRYKICHSLSKLKKKNFQFALHVMLRSATW